MPTGFRFYGLRHTGNTLAAESGASLKDLMVRMGQPSVRAALLYPHSTLKRQREIANDMDARVRTDRKEGDGHSQTEGRLPLSRARIGHTSHGED